MIKITIIFLSTLCYLVIAKKFTTQDFVQLPRPNAAVTSPSGALAVFTQSEYSIDLNKSKQNLYLLNVDANKVEQITEVEYDMSLSEPFFLDDQHVAYLQSNASSEDVDQIYVLNLARKQEGPYRLTDFPIPFGNLKYNLKRKLLAFSAAVYKDEGTLEGTLEKDNYIAKTKKDSAVAFDQLMVRKLYTYLSEKKNNIFVVDLSIVDRKYVIMTKPINLLKGTDLESPVFVDGSADDFTISPDASQVAFVSRLSSRDNAWRSDSYVYTVSTSGKDNPVAINSDIHAASHNPYYTPSGLLVYLQMFQPQDEADRNRLVVFNPNTQERRIIADHWDRSPWEVVSSLDSKTLYVTAEDQGRQKIFAVDIESEKVEALTEEHSANSLNVLPSSGNILFSHNSMSHPLSTQVLDIRTKSIKTLASESKLLHLIKSFQFDGAEDVRFIGALNEEVHGWYIKPSNYQRGRKYPLLVFIHGGPQASTIDSWSSSSNSQVFSDEGYGVFHINFHGSTGYGQNFTNSIRNNWGSYPFVDIEAGVDHVLQKYCYLDKEQVMAIGGSYGGYMINWLNGHSRKFKAFVNHAGIFSTTQLQYTIDVLYFMEEQYGGSAAIDRKVRENLERWSPSNYAQFWRTPTLFIHGGIDYRVPVTESLAAFTALQRQDVPSRFLYFPDETHGIASFANILKWHEEVLAWFKKYCNACDSLNPTLHLQ